MIHFLIEKRLQGAQGGFVLQVGMEIAEGEFVALFGPSGVGKTTLLRCLAGLESPDYGMLRVGNDTWLDTDAGIVHPPQQRQVGFMFQDFALFPNMTVRGNLEFALKKGMDRRHVDELLDMMELRALQHRKPQTLSGGQKQRVALARALVSRPRLLLLDEPLSALEPGFRSRLQDELLRLQRRFGFTTILVSHEIGEVYKLATRAVVLKEGRIVRQGTPAEVFTSERISGKFRFTGEVLAMEPADIVLTVTVLIGNQVVRVVAMPDEAQTLKPGDRVALISKAFNPVIMKLE
jgi:molybdate transport system ATP-binding protein